MSEIWADIEAFHTHFNLPTSKTGEFPSKEIMTFRMKFLKEELGEFIDAYTKNNIVEAFDALIDLAYVTIGTARFMGLPFDKGWTVVHRANMKKVRAKTNGASKRGSKFDVIKPQGWVSPNEALKALITLSDNPYLTVSEK